MLLRVSGVAFVAMSCATQLLAQGTTSRLTGQVVDPTGALVAGASVQLTNEGTGAVFSTNSTEAGSYSFEAVQSGKYTVTVETPGFKRFVARNNTVSIGQPTTVNARLEVGAVAETVEVTESYEAVQTSTSGNIGNLFSENVIRELPIVGTRGRNPLDLVNRQPGVVSGGNTGGGVHVNGARDRAWNYTIDGIDTNETSAGGSNFSPARSNPDSLAEFKVITSNFTTEYGRSSGAQVAMVTRSGTNEIHGSGFWFYRTPRLNANEWENNINNIFKRQFQQQIYGGTIGGPIKRNKLFYFANVQRLTARNANQANRTVYTADARRGIFRYVTAGRNTPAGAAGASVDASGNVVPGTPIATYNIAARDPEGRGLNSRIQSLIGGTPLPNNFTGGDGLNTALFTFAGLQNESQNDNTIKADYIVNDKHTIFFRALWGFQNTLCDNANGGLPFFPGGDCIVNTKRDPKNFAFNWRTNPSPRWTNELVFGLNRFAFDFVIPPSDLGKVSLTGPITIPETFDFGNARKLNTWQFVDNVSWFAGAHQFKFGLNIRNGSHQDVRGSIGGQNSAQSVNFSRTINTVDPARFGLPTDINQAFDRINLESNINFLLGRVGSTGRGFPSMGDEFVTGLYDFKAKFPEYDFYAQDSWKVRRNLVIDYGLRWEIRKTPTSDPFGRVRAPEFPTGPSDTLRWQPSELFKNQWRNFAPSFGFAWDPFGKGKTSIRSNYRIAFDRMNTFVLSSSVFQNLPGQVVGVVNQDYGQAGGRLDGLPVLNPPTIRPSQFSQPTAFSANNITIADPNMKTPTTHMWSFGIQQQVARNTVVQVDYIGRRAYHLFGAHNANQAQVFNNGFADAFRVVQGGGQSPLINQLLSVDPRRTAAETGSDTMRRLYPADLRNNSVAFVASDLSRRTGAGGRTVADLSGVGKFFFIAYPQFAGGLTVLDSNDFSTYHGLQTQIERRFSNGLTFQVGYTFAKSLDTRSFDPAFSTAVAGAGQSASSTPFDFANRKLNYAPSDFDRTHVLQSYWVYELPFGKGRMFGRDAGGFADRIIGGWQVAGFLTLQGGRPFTVFSGFNSFSSVVGATANCSNCPRSLGTVYDDPSGLVFYLNPEERARFSNPGVGELGNTGRNYFRGPGSFNMDLAFSKNTSITERLKLQIRADATNLTNTPTFGFPTTTLSSTLFGRIRDNVISGSRKIQLAAKFTF